MANQRKKLLIEPRFQIWFILYTLSGAVLSSVIFYLASWYFFWSFSHFGQQAGLAANNVFYQFLDTQRAYMDRIFFSTVILLLSVLTGIGLVLSNRVAGPIYRLRMHLANILETKKPVPLTFRKEDFFREIAPLLNSCLEQEKSRKINEPDTVDHGS